MANGANNHRKSIIFFWTGACKSPPKYSSRDGIRMVSTNFPILPAGYPGFITPLAVQYGERQNGVLATKKFCINQAGTSEIPSHTGFTLSIHPSRLDSLTETGAQTLPCSKEKKIADIHRCTASWYNLARISQKITSLRYSHHVTITRCITFSIFLLKSLPHQYRCCQHTYHLTVLCTHMHTCSHTHGGALKESGGGRAPTLCE